MSVSNQHKKNKVTTNQPNAQNSLSMLPVKKAKNTPFSQGARPDFGCEPAFACMAFSPFFPTFLLQNDAKT